MLYPRNEIVWVGYYNAKGDLMFIITSKETRDWYYLYRLVNGRFEKIGKAKEPLELVEKFGVLDTIQK